MIQPAAAQVATHRQKEKGKKKFGHLIGCREGERRDIEENRKTSRCTRKNHQSICWIFSFTHARDSTSSKCGGTRQMEF